jgi:proprotein convertase subtilisin/kexin type 5
LYVVWENVGSSTYAATAGYCILNAGPRFGQVNFNIGATCYNNLSGSNFEFDRNLEITIHEVTHVLGFSGSAMQNWFQPGTTTMYGAAGVNTIVTSGTTVRGISTTNVLSSPNVLQVARDHYGCPGLTGMLIENQGGGGSLGSHWERTILNNEIMNAIASNTDAFYSKFTFALLKDTNWYLNIDMS